MEPQLKISYKGSLLERIPVNANSFTGIVLTRTGELVIKKESKWEVIKPQEVYLFLDLDTNITFLVDTYLKKIKIYAS